MSSISLLDRMKFWDSYFFINFSYTENIAAVIADETAKVNPKDNLSSLLLFIISSWPGTNRDIQASRVSLEELTTLWRDLGILNECWDFEKCFFLGLWTRLNLFGIFIFLLYLFFCLSPYFLNSLIKFVLGLCLLCIGFLLNTLVCHFSTLTFGLFVFKGNEYVSLLVSGIADLNEGWCSSLEMIGSSSRVLFSLISVGTSDWVAGLSLTNSKEDSRYWGLSSVDSFSLTYGYEIECTTYFV